MLPLQETVLHHGMQARVPISLVTLKTSDIFIVGAGTKKERRKSLSDMFADQPDLQAAFDTERKFDFHTIFMYILKYNMAAATNK